jgi:hypothetical protein
MRIKVYNWTRSRTTMMMMLMMMYRSLTQRSSPASPDERGRPSVARQPLVPTMPNNPKHRPRPNAQRGKPRRPRPQWVILRALVMGPYKSAASRVPYKRTIRHQSPKIVTSVWCFTTFRKHVITRGNGT